MPNIVLYTLVSLDGATEDPHRYFPETGDRPGAPVFDEELALLEAEMLARQGAVILGRRTYDEWSRYWPTSDEQPFADFINAVPKYVLTSTPLTGGWTNAQPISGPLAEVVADVKARADADVGVHASITLAKSLLAEGLVDELCLAVGRVLDPVGPRLFAGLPGRRELELVEAAATSSGSVWLRYRLLAAGASSSDAGPDAVLTGA
ncbi:MAG: dihydrofolate reductase family protein [Gaiellaceae bacterium]